MPEDETNTAVLEPPIELAPEDTSDGGAAIPSAAPEGAQDGQPAAEEKAPEAKPAPSAAASSPQTAWEKRQRGEAVNASEIELSNQHQRGLDQAHADRTRAQELARDQEEKRRAALTSTKETLLKNLPETLITLGEQVGIEIDPEFARLKASELVGKAWDAVEPAILLPYQDAVSGAFLGMVGDTPETRAYIGRLNLAERISASLSAAYMQGLGAKREDIVSKKDHDAALEALRNELKQGVQGQEGGQEAATVGDLAAYQRATPEEARRFESEHIDNLTKRYLTMAG